MIQLISSLSKHFFSASLLVVIQLTVMGETNAADDDQSVLLLFGDSISQGYNDAFIAIYGSQERLAAGRTNYGQPDILLSNILNESGRTSLVANHGAGGSPSGASNREGIDAANSGVSRVDPDIAEVKTLYSGENYYLLIMYGTNDYNYYIGPSTTGFNIQLMIQEAIDQGYTPVVGTIPPYSGNTYGVSSVNAEIEDAVNAKTSASNPVYFADHYSKLVSDWSNLNDDGVHPNDAGYLIIAQNWFDSALEDLINRDASFQIAPVMYLLLDD